jgi:hypothetical protein
MAHPAGYRPLPGSERPQIAGSTLIERVDATERISVTLLLRRKPGSPDLPDLQHWQDTPPGKRKYLSVDEFYDRHGAADDDVDAVVEYLTSKGLEVLDKHAGRRRIVAQGTVAEVEGAFAITLSRYRAPERVVPHRRHGLEGRPFGDHVHIKEHVHRGFEGPVHLPAKLVAIVSAVVGLDNRRLGGPAGIGTGDPPGAAYLSPATIAQRYNFPTTTAVGQTIGIFEAGDSGAAYLHLDIQSFIQSLPGGAALPLPNLADIGLLGNTNNPALVTSPPTGAVFECTIDVSIAAAIGLGANINVYFTDGTEPGWEAFFNRAIFPAAGDNPPSVLSASWVPYLSDDSGTVGSLSTSGSPVSIFDGYLQSAAARGITVLMAIGDWGSNNLYGGVGCHVSYPNGDPWVTACGGTILGDVNPSPPPNFDEWTWSDANVASPFDSPPYEATGGGVSDTFPRPPYQVAAGVQPISKNDGNERRGVPDVAGMVAMSGFFTAGVGGPGQNAGFGTSAVAPLYAGLVAIINAFLGRNVGFLNPTLYMYGPQICNDITVGNNDSGNAPDSPFYTAAIGWDPCTGWGSINGVRLLAALAPAPIIVTTVADTGNFGNACLDSFVDEILTINNSGFSTLLIWKITAFPADFEVPGIASYPVAVSPGGSIDLVIRFRPSALGFRSGTITIFSNDLFGPRTISVTGTAQGPRLVLVIADRGSFGDVCVGSFVDGPLLLSNSGKCTLSVTDITSSSAEFVVPQVLSYPITVGAGDFLPLPIRFEPTSFGLKSATITVTSNDPASPAIVDVSGDVPSGRLAVTGSTCFGGVTAGCCADRAICICNTGDCKLEVRSVRFKRKSRHWKLLNNPFPAKLHPGACLSVVIQYKATERCPRSCELVIESDDPVTPTKVLDVLAYTIWSGCSCTEDCEDCRKGCCEKHHKDCGCRQGYACCCDDDDDEGE